MTSYKIIPKVVPWRTPDLFAEVHDCLFSTDIHRKKWAVEEISVWETKCHPSLPSAIEATYLLASAIIQDVLWTNEACFMQHNDIQAIYCSAITRFISLSVDNLKGNGCFSHLSAAQIAKMIGVPSFIVDIRNECCHSSRPSLSVLRLATDEALKYLKECYWDKEVILLKSYVKPPPDETNLFNLFNNFIKFNEDVFQGIKFKKYQLDDGSEKVNDEFVKMIKSLESYLKEDVHFFVKVLVSDGIFIPSDKDLENMVSEEEYRFFKIKPLEHDDEDMDIDATSSALEFEKNYLPQLPVSHEILWIEVIKLLNKHDAIPLFMEELLKSQGNRTVVGQKLLISWILKILRIHTAGFSQADKRLPKVFRNKGIVPNWNRLFHAAVINPCKYTMSILPLISTNVDFDKDTQCRIIGLMALKLGLAHERNQENKFFKSYYTPEELKSGLEMKRMGKNPEKANVSDSIWSLCPDKCYKSWPIGHIVNEVKSEDGESEKVEGIFKSEPMLQEDFSGRVLPSNKNDDDDDDVYYTSKRIKRPDLNKMMSEIRNRDSVMLKRPD